MSEYVPTIGLEIHAELNTQTKMFCNSKNDSNEMRPNTNVCPVCLAHPGTLPVINREAVRSVLRVGAAVGGTLADYTEFDRKNYFYPDLPKGYQLSQYEFPLVSGGSLNGVKLTRVHLEEDTARSQHDDATGETMVDYNRAGVPLMELVTEPEIHSAKDALAFAKELQLLLRTLGVSDANMEKGEMRVEANISVSKISNSKDKILGTKVEIKNLNSFRTVERACAYEIERQIKILESGDNVVQQTLGWNDATGKTFAQRTKEGSADYRYFPDPDLPSVRVSEIPGFDKVTLTSGLPELPWVRRSRYLSIGLKNEDAEMFTADLGLGRFFDEVTNGLSTSDKRVSLSANYIANDLANISRDTEKRDTESQSEISISPQNFRKLIDLLAEGKLSSRAGKDVLTRVASGGGDPMAIIEQEGLLIKSDTSDLMPIIEAVCSENPKVVADYKAGKEAALQFLVGQAMRKTRGAGNPEAIRTILKEYLS